MVNAAQAPSSRRSVERTKPGFAIASVCAIIPPTDSPTIRQVEANRVDKNDQRGVYRSDSRRNSVRTRIR